MSEDNTSHSRGENNPVVRRRHVLKALGAGGTAALAGSGAMANAAAKFPVREVGEVAAEDIEVDDGAVAYQYFHSEWSEIEADVDRLEDLGIDRIWVPQPSTSNLGWEDLSYDGEYGFYEERSPYGWRDPHPPMGYQPVDLSDFDSSFGTEAELESLIDTCHDHDIEVIVDTVLNHMSSEEGPDGTVELPQFDRDVHFNDYGTIGEDCELEGERALYECSLLGLPDFDVEQEYVQQKQKAYVQRIADLGADGLRYDAAAHIWPWYFGDEINVLADELGLWRVGEVWDEGDVDRLLEFVDTGMTVFDFPLYRAIKDAFEGGDMRQLSQASQRGVVHHRPEAAVTFVQNHDTVGPNVEPDEPEGRAVELAEAFVIAYAGMPMLYRSNPEDRSELDDDALATLVDVAEEAAGAPVVDRQVDQWTYVFEREGALLAGINRSGQDRTYTVDTSWSDATLVDRTGNGPDVAIGADGSVEITVPAEGYVMYAPGDGDPDPDPDPELLAEWTDGAGDDHGPGPYTYPTADDFNDGAFDLLGVRIEDAGDSYRFVLEVDGLRNPWDLGAGYSLQYLQLYVHDPAGDDDRASAFAAEGVNVAFERDCHRRIHANGEEGAWIEDGTGQQVATGTTTADLAADEIEIEIPADAIAGDIRDVELVPLVLGYDGLQESGVRPVTADGGEWTFGGGADDTSNPNVIDLLTPEGVDNSEALEYSAETGAVVPLLELPKTVADYANENGVVDRSGLLEAVDDWRAGEIGIGLLNDVIDAWRSGDPVTGTVR